MTWTRRDAIQLLCSTGVAILMDPFAAFTQPPPTRDGSSPGTPPNAELQLRHTLLGYATAYEIRDQPEQRARTLRALGHIARQRPEVDAGRKTVAEAAAEIRAVIDTGWALDPVSFGQLATILQPSLGDVDLSVAVLRGVTGGLLSDAGGILAASGAGVGVSATLAGLGAIADGALSRGPQALRELFPRPADDQVVGLTAWAVKRMADLADQSPRARGLALDLHASGHLPINLKRTASDAAGVLPAPLRRVVMPHVASTAPRPSAADTAEAVRKELHEGMDRLDKKTGELFDIARRERAAVRAVREALAQRQVQSMAQEMAGVGVFGNILISGVAGQPDLGRQVQGFAQAGASIYVALATPGLGPLAVAGTLANAASRIFGLFGSQPDPLLEALQAVHQKLGLVLDRLDIIAEQQRDILRSLRQVYEAIAANYAILVTVQSHLSALAKGSAEGAVAAERVYFDNARNQLGTLLLNNAPSQIAADTGLRALYDARTTDCYTFATDTARSPNAGANLSVPLSDAEWRDAIRARGRADRLVGVLPGLAGRLGVALPSATGARAQGPVSPTAWAEGVSALLEGRTRAAELGFPAEVSMLQELWRDGVYLRGLVVLLTSSDAIRLAGRKLRDAAGIPADGQTMSPATLANANSLVGEVYRTARTYDAGTVPRSHSASPAGAKGRYWISDQPVSSVNFSADYFQMLLDNNLIRIENCVPAGFSNAGWENCEVRVNPKGPWENQLLVPDKVTVKREPYYYPAASGNYPAQQIFNPYALQDAAKQIALAHLYRPQVQTGMFAAIRARLGQLTYPTFEYWGEVVRFLGALICWRAPVEDRGEDLLLANSWGPYTLPDLARALEETIEDRLSWAGDWPLEAAQAVDVCLQEAIEGLRSQAVVLPSNKGLPVVDETLRRLVGYMIARGIDVPQDWD